MTKPGFCIRCGQSLIKTRSVCGSCLLIEWEKSRNTSIVLVGTKRQAFDSGVWAWTYQARGEAVYLSPYLVGTEQHRLFMKGFDFIDTNWVQDCLRWNKEREASNNRLCDMGD